MIYSGWKKFDEIVDGFRDGSIYRLAGPPKQFKTTWLLSLAANIAMKGCDKNGGREPVLFVSFEANPYDIYQRLVLAGTVSNSGIYIISGAKDTIRALCEQITKSIKRNGIRLLILDPLIFGKEDGRRYSMGSVVTEMKALAEAFQIPVIISVRKERPEWVLRASTASFAISAEEAEDPRVFLRIEKNLFGPLTADSSPGLEFAVDIDNHLLVERSDTDARSS